MATATRQYKKEQGSDVLEGEARYGFGIRVGQATLAWCHNKGCWLLPDGPNQKNRLVSNAHKALRFARNMHCEMTGVRV